MNKFARSMLGAVLALALGASLGASEFAAAQTSGTNPTDWQFELTPYFWAAGLKGPTQIGRLPQINVNESFLDILRVLDFAAMGTFEARKERWGLLLDGMYFKLSDGMTATRTGPGPIGATATANANLTIKQTLLTGGVAYRVLEGSTPVDIIGGARYNKLSANADIGISFFGPLGLNPSATRSLSDEKSWTIPIIGARVAHPIADRWTLTGYADVGGSSGNSGWQLAGGAAYAYSKDVSLKFGYRALKIDYNKNGFLYDVTFQGPYVAATFNF